MIVFVPVGTRIITHAILVVSIKYVPKDVNCNAVFGENGDLVVYKVRDPVVSNTRHHEWKRASHMIRIFQAPSLNNIPKKVLVGETKVPYTPPFWKSLNASLSSLVRIVFVKPD